MPMGSGLVSLLILFELRSPDHYGVMEPNQSGDSLAAKSKTRHRNDKWDTSEIRCLSSLNGVL